MKKLIVIVLFTAYFTGCVNNKKQIFEDSLPDDFYVKYGNIVDLEDKDGWCFIIGDQDNNKVIRGTINPPYGEFQQESLTISYFYDIKPNSYLTEEQEMSAIVQTNSTQLMDAKKQNKETYIKYLETLEYLGISEKELNDWIEEVKFTGDGFHSSK